MRPRGRQDVGRSAAEHGCDKSDSHVWIGDPHVRSETSGGRTGAWLGLPSQAEPGAVQAGRPGRLRAVPGCTGPAGARGGEQATLAVALNAGGMDAEPGHCDGGRRAGQGGTGTPHDGAIGPGVPLPYSGVKGCAWGSRYRVMQPRPLVGRGGRSRALALCSSTALSCAAGRRVAGDAGCRAGGRRAGE
jgi:hypothetical protein